MLTPEVRGNAGCYAPIAVTARAGSALNCDKPASTTSRTRISWWLGPNLHRALAPVIPDRVQAFTGQPKAFNFYGRNHEGRVAADHFFMGGGQGGSAHGDGKSGLLFPTSAANTPVELLESRMPVLVEEKSLVADSGGPGRQRGGLGQRLRARRFGNGDPIMVGLFPEGWERAPKGCSAAGRVAMPSAGSSTPTGGARMSAPDAWSRSPIPPWRSRCSLPAAPAMANRASGRPQRSQPIWPMATSRRTVHPRLRAMREGRRTR